MGLYTIKNCANELTPGEKNLLNKINKLYKNYNKNAYLYIQPNICKLVPDFILIDECKGICIIEVKDWSMEYIVDINRRRVQLIDRDDDNPVYKTKKYLDILNGIISTSDEDIEFIENNIYANTALTNISSEDMTKNKNIQKHLNQNPINCITSDMLKDLSIDDLFSENKTSMTEQDLILLRTTLFPETKIKQVSEDALGNIVDKTIHALDIEQENFARRLPYGHYMVTGVPGSGKSVMLIARALHLAKENPNWKIQILTYNKSLSNKIESTLNSIAEDIKDNNFFSDIPTENINVVHFHKLAKDLSNIEFPEPLPDDWWDEILPNIVLSKCRPIYDAVLIDEYQDFRDTWIKVCISLCKKHKYMNSSNKEVEGINLFLAGDRLQSIYNPKVHNWSKDFGINMKGRSKLLKTSYRAGKENTTLALKFLQINKFLKDEVDKFYKDEDEDSLNLNDVGNKSSVTMLDGDYTSVVETINDLINCGYKYNDILLVCTTKKICNQIRNLLPTKIKANTKFVKEATDRDLKTKLLTSTYHSSKGLEAKVAILVDVDRYKEVKDKDKDILNRKLIYVGMTRASQQLFLHASSFEHDSFAKDIKDLYEKQFITAE